MATAAKSKKTEDKSDDTVDLFNVNDGLFGRDGGPYLDQELQRTQEVLNARREQREPDFDNLPLSPGIVPVRLPELVQSHTTFRLAGQENLDASSPTVEAIAQTVTFVDEGADARVKAEREEQEKAEREQTKVSNAEETAGDDIFAGGTNDTVPSEVPVSKK